MSAANAKRMRGLAIHRSILIGNTATPLTEAERITSPPDHTHKWTVAVRSAASHPLSTISEAEQLGLPLTIQQQQEQQEQQQQQQQQDTSTGIAGSVTAPAAGGSAAAGAASAAGMGTRGRGHELDYHKMVGGKDDISHFIKRVQFKLHETYPQHTRNVDKPPFQVTETGWGEFDVQVRIFFVAESGEKPISTFHRLKIHPWHPIAVPTQQPQPADEPGRTSVEGETSMAETQDADQSSAQEPTLVNGDDADTTDVTMAMEDGQAGQSHPPHSAVATVKTEDASGPLVHTRSTSAAVAPAAPARPLPAVVHSWAYDELVFPEPTEAFYEVLINNQPTPLPAYSAQAFSDPVSYRQYKHAALAHLDTSSGPQGRDLHAESGIVPPHPLHDASGALFDALSQEAILAEGERLDKARHNAVRELEETRSKLIDGERNLRQGRTGATATAT